MKKPRSRPIFDDSDFPISLVRKNFFNGTGYYIDELMEKPLIGIVNSQTDINPGHIHLDTIAQRVKEGVHAGGGMPFEFSVPAPCDGMTEGHEGMRFVLAQRDLIAEGGKVDDPARFSRTIGSLMAEAITVEELMTGGAVEV